MVCTLAFERAAQMAQGMNATLRIVAFVHQNILDEANDHQGLAKTAHRSPLGSFQRWLIAEAGLLSKGGLQVCAEVVWCERNVTNLCHYIEEAEVDYVIKDMEEDITSVGRTFSMLDWQLLHESRVPVLFVQHDGAATPRKIVAAVDVLHYEPDVREMNRSSMEAASQLAAWFGATVHVMSVYDREALPVAEGNDLCPPSLLTYEQARKRFDLLADQYAISAQCRHFVVGACATSINRYVSDCQFDVLVFGATNYMATDLLLGRTAQRVLGHPPCSLLALKDRDVHGRPALSIHDYPAVNLN
jgi:universal stress protein E